MLLVRHGSAAHEPNGPSASTQAGGEQADPTFSPAGVAQDRRVAVRPAGDSIERLFVTSLRRTQQTAELVGELLRLEPEVVPDLREVALGELEGDESNIGAMRVIPCWH